MGSRTVPSVQPLHAKGEVIPPWYTRRTHKARIAVACSWLVGRLWVEDLGSEYITLLIHILINSKSHTISLNKISYGASFF